VADDLTIKAVVFDLDGTLVDSRTDLAEAVNYALRSAGLPEQTEADILPHVGNGVRVLLSEVFGPVSDEALKAGMAAFANFYEKHCLDHTRLYNGVKESVEELSRSARLAVVTNKPFRFAETILRGLGLRDRLATVVGGDSLPERKPHPAPVLKALGEMGASPIAALMVGDGVQDIAAGQAAGTHTCVARYGFGFNADTLDLRPDYTINAFSDIKEIVL
jgi:phosphoglycolate phosphatase